MMPRLFATCLAILIMSSARADGPESIFNGKDLTGWTGDPKLWSVLDGAITGRTDGKIPANSFLIWNGTAGDFELRLKFRIEGNNSGIQYRSKVLKDVGPFVVGGYQADIDGAGKYTGILYEERGRGILAERGQRVEIDAAGKKSTTQFADAKSLMDGVDQKVWNDYVITAVGNTLTHSINGRKTVEVIDRETDNRSADGVIALQLHTGEPTTVQFKGLHLKRLAVKPPPPAGFSAADAPPKWVWTHNSGEHQSAFLRKALDVPAGVTVARLVLSADDAATVFIDGVAVLSNSHWLEPAFKEVADKLSPGRHVIAIKARNEMSAAGVLLRVAFESQNREPFSLSTDATWKALDHEPIGWERLDFNDVNWPNATVVGSLGDKPWDKVNEARLALASKLREPTATPPERIKIARDFKVELLYSVPKDKQGSWVNMCADPKGRLYVSDQYGALYRIAPPPIDGKPEQTRVERVPVEIGEAQGMLWAFDSLYIVVNRGGKFKSGLYRLRDANGDDQLDEVTLLRELHGDGEHGPHAVILAPDGKSLFVLCGNMTKMTELAGSRVPRHWGEDHLLPRMPDGRGFMAGVLGPGGCIYQVDRDGREWTLFSTGYRNPYDIAFNRDGELFTYDADMEWDISTPWYRPTRVCHVVSGSDWGWRNGSGKWPPYYADTLPPVVDIGPGSPTGICFGYGAKFPAKYQNALFMCDWSYGKLYAVHLSPKGSSYSGVSEDFLSGNPLPLTDVVISPIDGAMYFTIGGRKTKSGLYRVTYVGSGGSTINSIVNGIGKTVEISGSVEHGPLHYRRQLESQHESGHFADIESAWRYLSNSDDRFLRSAARVALEHIDAKVWKQRALNEKDPAAALEALLALVRVGAPDPAHCQDETPAVDVFLQAEIVDALLRLRWDALSEQQRLELLRIYQIFFNRFGPPGAEQKERILAALDSHYPAKSRNANAMLCEVLVYLEAPRVLERTLALLKTAPTQEEQLDYAKALRVLKPQWTPELRRAYFDWFVKAATYSGGMSFGGFLNNIRRDALANVPPDEATKLLAMLEAADKSQSAPAQQTRPFVRKWTVADLDSALATGLRNRDFDRGRTLFGATSCFACHRFANEGGAQGPDLTQCSGRFSPRDLLESIVEPSKEISDQYAAVMINTVDGKVIAGRIINLNGDTVSVLPNMLEPHRLVTVDVRRIESQEVSKVSMMPEGLLETLTESEILDLLAYLLSRGDRDHAMFKK